jgi:fatty-acyl-CoA synthase
MMVDPHQRALRVGDVPELHAANPTSRDRIAVTDGHRSLTWRELDERATALAGGIAEHTGEPGAPVAVYAGNRIEYLELIYGLAKGGNPIVPLSPRLLAAEVARSMRATGARVLITDQLGDGLVVARMRGTGAEPVAPYSDVVAAGGPTPEPPEETAPFRLSFTSGTTGSPKVCVVPHRVAMQMWADMTAEFGIGPDDVELVAGPLFHGLGFTCALQQLYAGGKAHVLPRFDARLVVDAVSAARPTVLPGVPIMFQRVLDALPGACPDPRTDSVRLVLNSGARVGGAQKRLLAKAFPAAEVCEFLASTEAGIVTVNRADPAGPKAESCGRPFFRTRVEAIDERGAVLPPGQVGEIAKRGLLTGPVYLGDERRTAESFVNGWYRTGDLGYRDEDGYFFVVGRSKEVIVSGGTNIYPAEIEEVIAAIDGVREVAVVGVPDQTWGESVKAAIVLADGARVDPAAVEARCRAALAGYKVPRLVDFVTELPRTPSGKVLRRELTAPTGHRRTDTGWT